jgi:hypothetical protein
MVGVRNRIGRLALAMLLVATGARAADKKACTKAFVEAQRLRKSNELVAAREALVTCGQDACPEVVRDKCVEWLPEVEQEIPTVVLVVQTPDGADLPDAAARIDDGGPSHAIDGKPIPLDPGEHVFEFSYEGETKRRTVVLTPREKDRRILVTFGVKRGPPEPPAGKPAPPPDGALPASFWILGGIGVVALGSFGYFGLAALGEKSDLEESCQPNCTEDEKASVDRKALIADISLGVAAVALGVAPWIALSSDASSDEVAVGTVVVPGGARAAVRVRF